MAREFPVTVVDPKEELKSWEQLQKEREKEAEEFFMAMEKPDEEEEVFYDTMEWEPESTVPKVITVPDDDEDAVWTPEVLVTEGRPFLEEDDQYGDPSERFFDCYADPKVMATAALRLNKRSGKDPTPKPNEKFVPMLNFSACNRKGEFVTATRKALVDSGASHTLIAKSLADRLGLKINPGGRGFLTASGKAQACWTTKLEFKFDYLTRHTVSTSRAFIVDGDMARYDMIIG